MNNAASFKANEFATLAENFTLSGDFQNASINHFRAAEQYLLAMNDTRDPEALKMLKMLYARHTREAKEVRKRMEMPKPPTKPLALNPESLRSGNLQDTPKAVHLFSQETPTVQGISDSLLQASLFVGQSNPVEVDESFMLLEREKVDDDPFNKFWEAVEGLVQKISNPVAFTTAPLTEDEISKKVWIDFRS